MLRRWTGVRSARGFEERAVEARAARDRGDAFDADDVAVADTVGDLTSSQSSSSWAISRNP